jgi:predicted Zn-dependent protease
MVPAAWAQAPPLVGILAQELERNFTVLKQQGDPAPYYMAYAVTDQEGCVVTATLGALKANSCEHLRWLDVTVRVGSPKLDNYHSASGERPQFAGRLPLPIEDRPAAIQRRAWLETDRVYRLAAEALIKIRASQQVKVAAEDDSDDFSREEPVVYAETPPRLHFASEEWAARVRKWSAAFAAHRPVVTSQVAVAARRELKALVNTEGTRLQHGRLIVEIHLSGRAKAADGMDVVLNETIELADATAPPKDAVVEAAIERLAKELAALQRAPAVEPYAGPAILSGRAAAVMFHEIFGHRIEGQRQKDPTEGQTFAKSVGQKILPEFLSVSFDPTRRKAGELPLNGWYQYDDEGVKAQPVVVVEKGVLKSFLMSRAPVRGFAHSNGHGRRAPGFEVAARQSNLIVESSQRVSEARLRQMLLEEARRQNKPYGLYFRQVIGGYTTTRRQLIQAYKVIPVVLYRVYVDGRPDELVRGADIVGTPLASLEKIVATAETPEVFNGYCGAESGTLPVSASSPAILVSQIEIQKTERSLDRPPLLPMPVAGAGVGP